MTLETDDSMGMSSVTEAAPWQRAGSDAVRSVPRSALRGPARLELVSADSSELQFAGRRAPLAPIFLTPLLLVLCGLPWLAPRPMDAVRLATSGVFLAAACGLANWAWPRRRRLRIAAKGAASGSALVAQPGRLSWVLDAEYGPNALSPAYTVSLEPDGGGSFTVLQSPDPERLIGQFSEVLRHWPGPVECRWGLPEAARPWNIEPQSGPRTLNEGADRIAVVVPLAHRPLLWCARIMATLVVADLIFLVTSAGAGLSYIHPLSLVLALALAGCLIALAVGLGSGHSSLLVGGRVRRESSLFGIRRTRGSLRVESVRGVYAVGVPSAEQWHILVDSSDGPLALPVPRRDADAFARQAGQAIFASRSTSRLIP
jgi:hypothetical protein